MSITVKTTAIALEKGDLTLPSKDVERYDSDCDLLMREIGEVITKDIAIPTKGRYYLVFFVGSKVLFTIVYDRDLDFESYKKEELKISKDMQYVILAD